MVPQVLDAFDRQREYRAAEATDRGPTEPSARGVLCALSVHWDVADRSCYNPIVLNVLIVTSLHIVATSATLLVPNQALKRNGQIHLEPKNAYRVRLKTSTRLSQRNGLNRVRLVAHAKS